MKYLPHFLLATAVALSFSSCATTGGSSAGGTTTQLGPHSAQQFVFITHTGARQLNENDPNFVRTVALVIKVEQKMNGGEQQIIASASAHRDGPGGALVGIDGLRVHVTQPSDFGTEPRKTGEARITKSVPTTGGKFKSVTAEATVASSEYTSGVATVTVPGDK